MAPNNFQQKKLFLVALLVETFSILYLMEVLKNSSKLWLNSSQDYATTRLNKLLKRWQCLRNISRYPLMYWLLRNKKHYQVIHVHIINKQNDIHLCYLHPRHLKFWFCDSLKQENVSAIASQNISISLLPESLYRLATTIRMYNLQSDHLKYHLTSFDFCFDCRLLRLFNERGFAILFLTPKHTKLTFNCYLRVDKSILEFLIPCIIVTVDHLSFI